MPVVGLLSLEFNFPGDRSLKDKCAVLRSVKDRLRRLNVAFAQVVHHDLLQRSSLAVAAVGSEQHLVQRWLSGVVEEVERQWTGVVVSSQVEWFL
jgi:uncharacterized protein YlxP (DUF503 family)